MGELEDLLGAGQVFEPLRAQGPEARRLGQGLGDELIGGAREQGLAAVRRGPQARAAVKRRADVVSGVAEDRLAAVQGDADPQLAALRPVGRAQLALEVERAGKRPRGLGEGDHGAVALALLERAGPAGGLDGALEELVVKRDRRPHRSGVGFPESRGALDVGEQEGDDALG